MKSIYFAWFCFCAILSSAQKTIDVTAANVNAMSPAFFNVVAGEPVVTVKFARLVEGTPYFKDEWMKGNVFVNGGGQYAGIDLKLDLYDNEVHFLDQKGIEMIATTSIQKIILRDSVSQQAYQFINGEYIQSNSRIKGWYQLLSEGRIILLKKINKQMQEAKPYGSATVERSIINSTRYYILHNETFTEIKKIKEIPDILSDKKQEVAQFIKSNNLSGKSDDDFISLFNYYNGLK
jgi:hypothetical protein